MQYLDTSWRGNMKFGCFGQILGGEAADTASLPTLVGGIHVIPRKKDKQVHGLYSCANRGCSACRGWRLSIPGSADEQPGPPPALACFVLTRQDSKADADSKAGPVGCNHAELFSKHDSVMLRGFAPRTPKSKPGQEAGKTYYGEVSAKQSKETA
jgi:hypothetical protein